MSKTSKKVVKQPLSPTTVRTIYITVICLVMAVILAVSLALVLKQPTTTPDDGSDGGSSGTSTLYIKNGDFAYFDDESDTFPKSADNWTTYTYKAPDGDTHGFTEITDSEKVISGVIDTDDEAWTSVSADLASQGITATNPVFTTKTLTQTFTCSEQNMLPTQASFPAVFR